MIYVDLMIPLILHHCIVTGVHWWTEKTEFSQMQPGGYQPPVVQKGIWLALRRFMLVW